MSLISNKNTTDHDLAWVLYSLGSITESPQFWSAIANDSAYRVSHRRFCVFQLFRRHVPPGENIAEMAVLLDQPRWVSDQDILIVTALGGKIPVKWTFEDTVFVLDVLPKSEDRWAVYLKISGKVDRDGFICLIRGTAPVWSRTSASVLEVGFTSDPV